MQSLTYQDIIDEKIAEWRKSLSNLEAQAEKSAHGNQDELRTKIKKLREAIDTATIQLHELDAHETVGNTMQTKDEILKIFRSIDKNFVGNEETTPFML